MRQQAERFTIRYNRARSTIEQAIAHLVRHGFRQWRYFGREDASSSTVGRGGGHPTAPDGAPERARARPDNGGIDVDDHDRQRICGSACPSVRIVVSGCQSAGAVAPGAMRTLYINRFLELVTCH